METLFCVMNYFSLAAFKNLYLSLSFNSFIMKYPGMDLLTFILLGVYYISLMCRLMFFLTLGKFSAIVSSNILFAPLSIVYFWDFLYAYVGR